MSKTLDEQLINAAKLGDTKALTNALDAGANINHQDADGLTAFIWTAREAKAEAARVLIERGANPNLQDRQGFDALHWANYASRPSTLGSQIVELIVNLESYKIHKQWQESASRQFANQLAKQFNGKVTGCFHTASRVTRSVRAQFSGMEIKFDASATVALSFIAHVKASNRKAVHMVLALRTAKAHPLLQTQDAPGALANYAVAAPPSSLSENEKILNDQENVQDLLALKLVKNERVAIIPKAFRLFCETSDLDLIRHRFEVLARLYHRLSKQVLPEKRFCELELLIKVGAKIKRGTQNQISQNIFGGQLDYAVKCPACGVRSNLIAQIDLRDSALPRNELGRSDFPILWCFDCGDWGPTFFDLVKKNIQPFGSSKESNDSIESGGPDLEARVISLSPVPAGKKAGRKGKLGGSPAWIQDEEIPECPKCKQGMTFVLQVASNSKISFGDMGMLYAFVCPDCKVSATLIQSH